MGGGVLDSMYSDDSLGDYCVIGVEVVQHTVHEDEHLLCCLLRGLLGSLFIRIIDWGVEGEALAYLIGQGVK